MAQEKTKLDLREEGTPEICKKKRQNARPTELEKGRGLGGEKKNRHEGERVSGSEKKKLCVSLGEKSGRFAAGRKDAGGRKKRKGEVALIGKRGRN